jgi:hypothetical protein
VKSEEWFRPPQQINTGWIKRRSGWACLSTHLSKIEVCLRHNPAVKINLRRAGRAASAALRRVGGECVYDVKNNVARRVVHTVNATFTAAVWSAGAAFMATIKADKTAIFSNHQSP